MLKKEEWEFKSCSLHQCIEQQALKRLLCSGISFFFFFFLLITLFPQSLLDHFRVNIKLVLNPRANYAELPMKTYHRYAMAPPVFSADTYETSSLFCAPPHSINSLDGVIFTTLPYKRLLTLAVDVLESWLVQASVARYDMDNIKLADIPERIVHAQFELRNILVQGSCHDERGMHGPRGLELALGTRLVPHMQDTIVMTNLGYLQLKANPTVQ